MSEGFLRAGYRPVAHVESDKAACLTLRTRLAYYFLKEQNQISYYQDYLKGLITREELYKAIPDKLLSSVINKSLGLDNRAIFKQIKTLLNDNEVDLIIGGPPCQSYSLVGRARDKNRMEGDKRNYLYREYYKYLKKFKPKIFLFENVPGILSANDGQYFDKMCNLFREEGYEIKAFKLNAKDFGVLQNRVRILIIGYKKKLGLKIPDFEKYRVNSEHSVNEIFSDLPKLKAGDGSNKMIEYIGGAKSWLQFANIRERDSILTQHVARPHTNQDKEIYRIAVEKWNHKKERLDYNDLPENLKTHANRHSFFDRFKVVAGDKNYSHTVVAHIAKDGHYYIHPDIVQNRSISVREAARLQSFPDSFYFEGIKESNPRTAAFKQIGNAVPPLMAYFIAEKLKEVL